MAMVIRVLEFLASANSFPVDRDDDGDVRTLVRESDIFPSLWIAMAMVIRVRSL